VSEHDGAFLRPRVFIPFIIITLIWGSTWIVIRDQLGPVPPTWSVAYRYIIACAAMFAYALFKKVPLRVGREGHLLALAFGIPQFFLNFNFVYAAEQYITSGIVAVVFALLLVPNSALAWLFLKHKITVRFVIGSAVAMAGVLLLFLNELKHSSASSEHVLIGIGLTLLGVGSAAFSPLPGFSLFATLKGYLLATSPLFLLAAIIGLCRSELWLDPEARMLRMLTFRPWLFRPRVEEASVSEYAGVRTDPAEEADGGGILVSLVTAGGEAVPLRQFRDRVEAISFAEGIASAVGLWLRHAEASPEPAQSGAG